MLIYGLYDPNDINKTIRYVGFTSKSPGRRIAEHICESNAGAFCHRHKWIRKIVATGNKPEFIILEHVNSENWQEREKYWIAKLKYKNLVNSTDGGEGLINPSQDVKDRISAKNSINLKGNQYRKGIPHNCASKLAISEGVKNSQKHKDAMLKKRGKPGHKITDEIKAKISAANKGKKHPPRSEEWKQKQKISQTGKKQKKETIEKRALKQIGNKRALGLKHNLDARLKISESRKGGRWINNGNENKYIKANELIIDGWNYGKCKK